jgi:acyl dehydratase
MDQAWVSRTIFKGLAARGWHTAAITMRLMVDGDLKPPGAIAALSV